MPELKDVRISKEPIEAVGHGSNFFLTDAIACVRSFEEYS